jgi:hypothetical protein
MASDFARGALMIEQRIVQVAEDGTEPVRASALRTISNV